MKLIILFAAIAYGVMPFDGDFLPGVGWVDDAAVIAAAIVNLLRKRGQ